MVGCGTTSGVFLHREMVSWTCGFEQALAMA